MLGILRMGIQRMLAFGLSPGLLPGLKHKLGFRDWFFLGGIKKMTDWLTGWGELNRSWELLSKTSFQYVV